MLWYKYISINVFKIYKYLYKFKWLIKKHCWNQFLNNIKNVYYINNNIKTYNMQFVIDKVIYFFLNYNVNFRIRKSKMRYLIFIKKRLFFPNLFNMSKISSYIISLHYKKNFYRQILYWYYNEVRPIKFNYNYNDLFKFYNSILKMTITYFSYSNLLRKIPYLYRYLRLKIFYKIKKFFNYICVQCLKMFKNFKNIKYFLYSFAIKKKKKKFFLLKKSNLFLKKRFNFVFIINTLIYNLILFFIKNWLDFNINFMKNNIMCFNINNTLNFFNKKIFNFVFIKYRIAWQRLYKITYSEYFKPMKFLVNFKKFKYF
jgi:hypothetical protein